MQEMQGQQHKTGEKVWINEIKAKEEDAMMACTGEQQMNSAEEQAASGHEGCVHEDTKKNSGKKRR